MQIETMLKWKQFDLGSQLIALLLVGLFSIANNGYAMSFFLFCYPAVGAAQLISCITHLIVARKQPWTTTRIYYFILVCIIFVLFLAYWFNVFGYSTKEGYKNTSSDYTSECVFALFVLAAVTPFMAIWYFWTTYRELKRIQRMLLTTKTTENQINETENHDNSVHPLP